MPYKKRNGGTTYVIPPSQTSLEESLRQPSTTLPPLDVQADALSALTQPWPLHAFWPLQALLAPAQAPVPLHELMPAHLTSAFAAVGATVIVAPAMNIAAAAVANVVPIALF